MVPKTGTRVRKDSAAGKKPRNSNIKPYISIIIPIIGQPTNTIVMPEKNARLAFHLCFWKKNQKVLSRPMINARPLRNSMFPIASNPLSNNSITPNIRNAIPNAAKPNPIFWKSVISNISQFIIFSTSFYKYIKQIYLLFYFKN